MSDLKPFDKITFEQYEALSEDIHIEIFEGILYDMANPSQEHQTISMELSTTINNYIKKKHGSCRVFSAPFDVKLNGFAIDNCPTGSDGYLWSKNLTENAVTVHLILSSKLSLPETPPMITFVNFTTIKMQVYVSTGSLIPAAGQLL